MICNPPSQRLGLVALVKLVANDTQDGDTATWPGARSRMLLASLARLEIGAVIERSAHGEMLLYIPPLDGCHEATGLDASPSAKWLARSLPRC